MSRVPVTLVLGLVVAALTVGSAAARSQSPEAAAARLDAFLDRFPDLGPGFAVVVVTADDVLLRHVEGLRRAGTEAPLTPDTPIYIASQTKAYVGMLAARLDAEGVLSLDDRITDHWPDVRFPEGVDPAAHTLGDLLSHQVPLQVGYITTLEAYVTELDAADYPALIAEHGEARDPGFRYSNLGYNVWAAILHEATGKSWRVWLDEALFAPLGLAHTSSRTSDFGLDELSWNHLWMGEKAGWYELRPKTDAMMQSAGGLVTSVDDMATWLQLQLRGAGPEGSGLTAAVVRTAHTARAPIDPTEPNSYELPCSGYALGWNVCDFEGHTLLIHGGGYTGARTMMAFSPDLGVGVGVFSNSDAMTGWFTGRTVVQYLQYLVEHPDAERMADVRERAYPQRKNSQLRERLADLAGRRGEARWQGWAWAPDAEALAGYAGTFDPGDRYRAVTLRAHGGRLMLEMGGYRGWLAPAAEDLFGLYTHPFDGPEPLAFERDDAGRVVAFSWDEERFARQPD